MDILERIESLRKEKDWSTSKLAKEADLNPSTVSNLFSRNNAPTFPTLEKICAAFGVSLAEFFSISTEQVLTKEQETVLEVWDKLTQEQKKNILPKLIEKI